MGAIMTIVEHPNKVLSTETVPVKEVTDEIRELVDRMSLAMIQKNGIGLAAPQVGSNLRLAIVHGQLWGETLPLVMINPEIIWKKHELQSDEGCLSAPGKSRRVERCRHITVKYMNMDGRWIRMPAKDLIAVVIQHEVDHLDGLTIMETGVEIPMEMNDGDEENQGSQKEDYQEAEHTDDQGTDVLHDPS